MAIVRYYSCDVRLPSLDLVESFESNFDYMNGCVCAALTSCGMMFLPYFPGPGSRSRQISRHPAICFPFPHVMPVMRVGT